MTGRLTITDSWDMSHIVDLHHHVSPDFYWEASNEDGNAAGGITPPRWSLDSAIAYLDEAGIDLAIASISTPAERRGILGGTATRLIPRLARVATER